MFYNFLHFFKPLSVSGMMMPKSTRREMQQICFRKSMQWLFGYRHLQQKYKFDYSIYTSQSEARSDLKLSQVISEIPMKYVVVKITSSKDFLV